MDIRKLKTILDLFENSKIREMEFVEGEERIRLCKDPAPAAALSPAAYAPPPYPPPMPAFPTPPADATAATPTAGGDTGGGTAVEKADGQVVTAPMVGTFYRSSGPDKPPFVTVGDDVREGDTLCIIEAMKLMNEIPSPASGRVRAICADNGEGVSFGAELFVIE